MATKEEYIKALNGMVEVYDNLDGCMSAISKFKRLIKLKDKGYFKCADYDTKIQDILSNCEVIKQ